MTTTDLTTTGQQSTALAIDGQQVQFNDAQVAALRHLGVEGASQGDLDVFFHVVKRTGLDPFARQIYMLSRRTRDADGNWVSKQTIQTGIDGYRLIGRRAADRAGVKIRVSPPEWCTREGEWRPVWSEQWGLPLAARITIHRDGEPFTAVALFDEYKQAKRDGALTSMWAQRPAGQIAKCAEALAWRLAFPQDLAGLYVEDELHHADASSGQQARPQRESAAAVLDERERVVEHQDDPSPDEQLAEDRITDAQQRKLGALMREAGITERDHALSFVSQTIGRVVGSRSELTKAEAGAVIDALEADAAQSGGAS